MLLLSCSIWTELQVPSESSLGRRLWFLLGMNWHSLDAVQCSSLLKIVCSYGASARQDLTDELQHTPYPLCFYEVTN